MEWRTEIDGALSVNGRKRALGLYRRLCHKALDRWSETIPSFWVDTGLSEFISLPSAFAAVGK